MIDPKQRFTNRVDDYVRYRPGYPAALFELLIRECRLAPTSRIADVGSGTGILARGLLEATAARVVAVEPNAAMREAAEGALSGEPRFESLEGSAEATGLPDADVDLVIAGQAFHWFDAPRARAEFARILRRGEAGAGVVALVWNQRADTPLNREYAEMLERFAPEYPQAHERERASEPKMRAFFAPLSPRVASFPNAQRLDGAGLRGRLLSSSYAPAEGHPLHAAILVRLDEIFRAHEQGGFVTLHYETIVWYGSLSA
jgi:SAM-dependent methyltransferase